MQEEESPMSHDPPYLSELQLHNFRLFESVKISKITPTHLIMGANGSGKTSILWAMILVLRAYNSRLSVSKLRDTDHITLKPSEVATLTNYPGSENLTLSTFIRQGAPDGKSTISAVLSGQSLECSITGNGVMNLFPKAPSAKGEKIRFASMAADAPFVIGAEERTLNPDDPQLGCARPQARGRYKLLSDISKRSVIEHLHTMFGISDLVVDGSDLYVIEQDGGTVEIMITGSAFRKVFVALVLLYTLTETAERRRIYLIEEPESLLYPVLQRSFMAILLKVCKQHAIQLFATSNSDCIREFFSPRDTYVTFGARQTGHHLTGKRHIRELIDLHLLGISDKPLLLCEGPHDPLFVATLAKYFGISTEHVQIRTTGGNCSSHTFQQLILQLAEDIGASSVRFLRDPDFRVNQSSGLNAQTSEFFWGLPTIESYLFLYQCEKHKKDSPLAFLRDPKEQAEYATAFANGFRVQNKSPADAHRMFPLWMDAMQAAKVEHPGTNEFLAVARVLHGHTWVEKLMKTKTPKLINRVETDVVELCPELGVLLSQLLDFGKREQATRVKEGGAG